MTFDPDELVEMAVGPDEPDEEMAILVFLTEASATKYVTDLGWLGASIVPVSITKEK